MMFIVTPVAKIFSLEATHNCYWALRKVLRPLIPHRDVPYTPGNVTKDISKTLGFSENYNYHGGCFWDNLPRWFIKITSPIQTFAEILSLAVP